MHLYRYILTLPIIESTIILYPESSGRGAEYLLTILSMTNTLEMVNSSPVTNGPSNTLWMIGQPVTTRLPSVLPSVGFYNSSDTLMETLNNEGRVIDALH